MADELDRDKRAMLSSLAELNDGANASSGAGGTASSGDSAAAAAAGGAMGGASASVEGAEASAVAEVTNALVEEYEVVAARLNGTDGELGGGLRLRLNKKEEAKLKKRLKEIVE